MSHCRRVILLAFFSLAIVTLTATGDAADPPPQATGNFEGKNWKFEAAGAYAFPSKVGFDDEQGIVVAVSNAPFNAAKLDTIWDRKHMIDTYFRDEETLVVHFQFSQAGEYRGMSYYFGPGDGCGHCYDGSTKTTLKIANGRVQGRVSLPKQKDDAFFDVTINVPLATADYGKPLPADGGDPGKVYAALHQALDGSEPDALKTILVENDVAKISEYGEDLLAALREQHPTKAYKIVKGFEKGDHALLVVEGENNVLDLKTEVHLQRENGKWRFDDEIMQVRLAE